MKLLNTKGKTWLHDPWFCSQVCQVHVGLPAINDGVGVLAGSFRSSSVSHGDKSVAPGLAGLPVGDDHRLLDLAEDLEVLAQAGVGGVVGQPPDKDLGVRRVLLSGVHLRARPAARAPAAAAAAPPPPAPRLLHPFAAARGGGRVWGRGRRRGGGGWPGAAEGARGGAAEVASSLGDLTCLSPPFPPAGHGTNSRARLG